ncbi:uncharacterized protein A4U43_C07F11080 [Asparagus officinalis]|uniref:BHLH domain-containing protein n=1 Tax=Asparagus officinalis TaxID=4686 RepID=A0A5P1EB34_ASPOF|nr:transcription factor EAT1-like [Asparagus officinalis]ONK63068.1 uncharacterized protein A4U43_C07F11080 [Asparagus officinalis]
MMFRMMNLENVHHDGFIVGDQVPVDAAAMYYDPATMFQSVMGQGGNGGCLVFDDGGYGGVKGVDEEGVAGLGNKRKKRGGHEEGKGGIKNEKQRRLRLSNKYEVLKALIPNPSKPDRATIISDTINYVQELLRTVNELKLLVDKKRRCRKSEIQKAEAGGDDVDSTCMKPLQEFKGALRSSWLQRKSRDTHVDVRIVEDEVFIKLTQHKNIDCLLVVARVLDELELEMLHLSGGNIGDLHVFMFNTKIHEGSSVYAGAIAKKIMEAMDIKQDEVSVCF